MSKTENNNNAISHELDAQNIPSIDSIEQLSNEPSAPASTEPTTTTTVTTSVIKTVKTAEPSAISSPIAPGAPLQQPESTIIKTTTTTTTLSNSDAAKVPPVPLVPPPPLQSNNSSNSSNSGGTSGATVASKFRQQDKSPISTLSASPVHYKSNIAPRQTVISRRANLDLTRGQLIPLGGSGGGSGGGGYHYSSNYSSNTISGAPISLRPSGMQTNAGLMLKETRQKEKRQLSELNDRFAGYVERVRFLEAQNKKLELELGNLRSKWGQETKQIEKMYQVELDEARNVLNDTSKTKDTLRLKLDKSEQELDLIRRKYTELEDYLNKDKKKINEYQDQIAANESEIGLLRRRLQDLQDEEKRYKQETQRMMNEIQRVSFELENEMKQRLILENDKQSLEEELLFLKEIHAKEIEELKHLSLHESGIDPSLFFKSELANAIREIREEYESLNQAQRNELEGWYRLKVSIIKIFINLLKV
jgi:hypothetical protein